MKKIMSRPLTRSMAAAFLAAILLPLVTAAREAPRQDRPVRARVERSRVLADLGLTAEQVKALEEFRRVRREERQAFREERTKLRGEMRELAKDPEANRARIDALIDKTAGLSAERRKAAFRARTERNKILTLEQREKLNALRSRLAVRDRIIGRAAARLGRMGVGRPAGLRAGLRRWARVRALRQRPLDRWRHRSE